MGNAAEFGFEGATNRRTFDEHLFWCWNDGMGIRATIFSVRQVFKREMSFEEVRLTFVGIADKFVTPETLAHAALSG